MDDARIDALLRQAAPPAEDTGPVDDGELLRWRRGQLPAAQRERFEARLAADPRLRELATFYGADHEDDRLTWPEESAPHHLAPWLRVAAAAVVVLGALGLWLGLRSGAQQPPRYAAYQIRQIDGALASRRGAAQPRPQADLQVAAEGQLTLFLQPDRVGPQPAAQLWVSRAGAPFRRAAWAHQAGVEGGGLILTLDVPTALPTPGPWRLGITLGDRCPQPGEGRPPPGCQVLTLDARVMETP